LSAGTLPLARLVDIANAQIAAAAGIVESKLALVQGTQALFNKIGADITTHAGLATVHQNAPALIATHAALTGVHGTLFIRKTADEILASSEVMQNDDELLLPVLANEVWTFLLVVRFTEDGGAPGFKFAFSIPGASTLERYDDYGNTGLNEDDGTTELDAGTTGIGKYFRLRYLYIGGANAGNVQLQWAQLATDVENLRVKENSFIVAHRIQ